MAFTVQVGTGFEMLINQASSKPHPSSVPSLKLSMTTSEVSSKRPSNVRPS